MPRTRWLLVAAAVLPLLVPPSAVAWDLLPLEDRLALEATEISSAKVCGAGECRELSDPEAARRSRLSGHGARAADVWSTSLGVRTPPIAGCPGTRARSRSPPRSGGEVVRVSVSVTVVPSAGLMRVGDGGVWVTLPSESKAAYAKLTAGLTPRPARTLPSVGEDALPAARVDEVFCPACAGEDALPAARVDEVFCPACAGTPAPASDGSNVWIVALGGGVLAALMAGLLLTIRHRRASTPPAAPEAPG